MLAGSELPYALLEYVWSNDAPVGGVLTDTDNTGGYAESWYGDIRFLPESR